MAQDDTIDTTRFLGDAGDAPATEAASDVGGHASARANDDVGNESAPAGVKLVVGRRHVAWLPHAREERTFELNVPVHDLHPIDRGYVLSVLGLRAGSLVPAFASVDAPRAPGGDMTVEDLRAGGGMRRGG